MTGAWKELAVLADGSAVLDGVRVESFAVAVDLVAVTAAASGALALVRSVETHSGNAPMWFYVDGEAQLTVTSAPEGADVLPEPSVVPDASESLSELFSSLSGPNFAEGGTPVGKSRRLLIAVAGVAGVLVAGGAVWGVLGLQTSGAVSTPAPVASARTTTAPVVTLPGYEAVPTWAVDGVDAAVAAGARVLAVAGPDVRVREAASGKVAVTAELSSDEVLTVVAGTVSGVPAVAAASAESALVWVGDAIQPLAIDLSGGRRLVTRTGALFVAGEGFSFSVVTADAVVPLVAPRSQMIVLGVAGEAIIWAGAPRQLVLASANGTVVQEVGLTPPADGATITPKVGWVRAATAATVVVGWTLLDGSLVTGVHATATGELLTQAPDTGGGFLSPSGEVWSAAGYFVDLPSAGLTVFPEGFTASRFLGAFLYGSIGSTGSDALLAPGADAAEPVQASTARPFAITDDTLLTLTADRLAAFPSTN